MIIMRNMEDKDIKTEIRDYLKEEADTHIRHWIAIKRESKRLYSDIEDRTKKIALKSSSLISTSRSSSISGITSQDTKEVCLFPLALKGDILTSLWTPRSDLR